MKFSKYTIWAMLFLMVVGAVLGITTYATRASEIKANDATANAITIHITLAIVTSVVVAAVLLKKKGSRAQLFLAPFSAQAFNRTKATLMFKGGFSILNTLRFSATLLLLYILLWEPFRSAMQPFAALDPNFRANAWGGPSYIGATLAHWLDSFILFYVAAILLHLVLLKHSTQQETNKK